MQGTMRGDFPLSRLCRDPVSHSRNVKEEGSTSQYIRRDFLVLFTDLHALLQASAAPALSLHRDWQTVSLLPAHDSEAEIDRSKPGSRA